MLDEVTARNLGLIEQAAVRLSPRLTVITGETGTGKTLMLGALRLVRGDKTSKGIIGPASDSCDVSARFVIDNQELVIRRVIDVSRSRAYIDNAAAPASALNELVGRTVAIIGQHDQLTITASAGVRTMVDRMLSDEGLVARTAYHSAWTTLRGITAERDALGGDATSLERERDTLAHQMAEIDHAAILDGEEEQLRSRVVRLRNADALAAELSSTLDALGDDEAGRAVDLAITSLRRVQAIDPSLDALVVDLQDMATSLNETATQVARMLGDLEEDAEDLAGVEDRLAVITSLKRRYGPTSEDVVTYRKTAGERHDELAAALDASETLGLRLADATDALEGAGRALHEHRATAAATISDVARSELKDLGFRDPIVNIVISHAPPGPLGADTASVRFASDASLEPGPVSAIASGGELSRLVLALTLASGASDASVIAFDEIDTGIGGSTALAMGEKLASLASSRQVICVTHLPQVAAFADLHLSVTRSGTAAEIVQLGPEERLTELTRMLAGLSQSETGRVHAEELLAIAQRHDAD